MKLHVITACMFATEKPIWRLRKSCEKFGIDLHPYGVGLTYTDWPHIKITKMLEAFHVEKANGATHVLYTDGRDSFFLTGLAEILSKYEALGSPDILMAAETACYPRDWLFDKFPDPGHHFRWPGSGQFMGEVSTLIRDWNWLTDVFMGNPYQDQNEQGWMVQALADGDLSWPLDTGCEIFQSAGNADCNWGKELFPLLHRETLAYPDGMEDRETWRIRNEVTRSWPCAVHFNGGYSSPETGKDAVMAPVWDALRMEE